MNSRLICTNLLKQVTSVYCVVTCFSAFYHVNREIRGTFAVHSRMLYSSCSSRARAIAWVRLWVSSLP